MKELGKILFKGQITEEEVHGYSCSGEGDDNVKLKKDSDPLISYDTPSEQMARIAFLSNQVTTALHTTEHLPVYHIPDILTPPPNRL